MLTTGTGTRNLRRRVRTRARLLHSSPSALNSSRLIRLCEQRSDLAGLEATMTAERLDIGDAPCTRPASHRLRVDSEHRGDLRRGEQFFGCVGVSHSASFPPGEPPAHVTSPGTGDQCGRKVRLPY